MRKTDEDQAEVFIIMERTNHSTIMPLQLESANVIDCGPHRTASRCVSWSASGIYLAFGSSDRLARLVTVEPTQAREVLVISGHQGPVTQTRFHPSDKTLVR